MKLRRWVMRGAALVLLLFLLFFPSGIFWNAARPVFHKDIINKYAAVYKFDPLLIMALVKVESRFRKGAESHKGALGLMQLMPLTAMEMAQKVGKNVTPEDLKNPEINIHLGIHYLYLLRNEFKTDTVAVLAAYNAGPANVRMWMQGGPLLMEQIPFQETRQYVERILETHRWLKRFQRVKNALT